MSACGAAMGKDTDKVWKPNQNQEARTVARTMRRNLAMDILNWPTRQERIHQTVFKVTVQFERCFRLMEHISVIS